MSTPEVSLANGITTTTTGPNIGVQPFGMTKPIIVDVYGQAVGTSGAINIIFDVQESVDGSSYTTASSLTLAGTFTSKPFAIQVKIRKPYMRINVTTITGTGAALYAGARLG